MNKSVSNLIEATVSEKTAVFFSGTPTLIAGVSGGADSMALLYLLWQLKVDVFVVHINYGLRGDESDSDQELVEQMAFQWGFECCSVRLNAEEANRENFQKWARDERYRIFNEFYHELNADAIVVAHHRDDQIETIIQKVFRGSGVDAWKGMSHFDGKIFRPLLEITKAEILQYCEIKAIPFRLDSGNLRSEYARNFIRNELSSEMDRLFPGWKENILRLGEFGTAADEAITQLSKSCFDDKQLSIKLLRDLNEPLKKAVLKKFLEQFTASVSRGVVEESYALMKAQTGAKLQLSKKMCLVKDRDFIRVSGNNEFESARLTKQKLAKGISASGFTFYVTDQPEADLYIDADVLQYPLTLRTWKHGDIFQPLGMQGSQKISDHLTNRKVLSSVKKESLVVEDRKGVIAVVLFESAANKAGSISEICKATDTTKQYLCISKNGYA